MWVGDGENMNVVLSKRAAQNSRFDKFRASRVRRELLQVALLVGVRERIIVSQIYC